MPTNAQSPLWQRLKRDKHNAQLFQQTADYALAYLQTIAARAVYPSEDALADLAHFDEALPDESQEAITVLEQLHQWGTPATVAQGGGRYFGFVNGNIIPTALAARWLADTWDQNAGLFVMSPIAAKLEQVCENWLVDLFGLPENTVAGFVTGTSVATMCGLLVGRNTLLSRAGWDIAERGLFGAPRLKVVMSEQAHSTVRKALAILGIGREQIQLVPADEQGRLDASHLPELDALTLVILQAGNVNSGAFDPAKIVCERANEAGAWVHVDGAFGLWAAASEKTKYLTEGIELADSWSVDMHKTLNAPYDSGVVLCKDRSAIVSALQARGAYLQFSDERDNMLYTPEMSRRARGIELWALLKNLGRQGVDSLIAQLVENAQLFGTLLEKEGFRVLNDVVFNQVIVVCDTPEHTQRTLQHIQASGECWCGGSSWQGEPVIRISVCSWETTPDDVERSVQAFVTARAETAD
ncbi:MAG: pyridoxal-dependent decarboxylase [Chloroflexota bacterium]